MAKAKDQLKEFLDTYIQKLNDPGVLSSRKPEQPLKTTKKALADDTPRAENFLDFRQIAPNAARAAELIRSKGVVNAIPEPDGYYRNPGIRSSLEANSPMQAGLTQPSSTENDPKYWEQLGEHLDTLLTQKTMADINNIRAGKLTPAQDVAMQNERLSRRRSILAPPPDAQ